MRRLLACTMFLALLVPAPVMAKHTKPLLTHGGESCVKGRLPPAQRWRGASVRCVPSPLAHGPTHTN